MEFKIKIDLNEIAAELKQFLTAIGCKNVTVDVPAQAAQQPLPVAQPVLPMQTVPVVGTQPAVAAVPTTAPVPVPVAAVPTAAPKYTIDQLAVASVSVADAGKREDVLALIHSFGVKILTELKPEQYGAYAAQLRKLGAKI